MLDQDRRKKIIGWVREKDSDAADDLAECLTDREHAVDVARAIAMDEDVRSFMAKVAAILERSVKADEDRIRLDQSHSDRWQAILGPKGLIAGLIAMAGSLGAVAVHDYLSADSKADAAVATP